MSAIGLTGGAGTGWVLAALVLGIVGLAGLSGAAVWVRRGVRAAGVALCLLGAAAVLVVLAGGGGPARLAPSARIAGMPLVFVLDGLSGFFVLALLPAGAVALAASARPGRVLAQLAAALGVLLAADAGALVLFLAAGLTLGARRAGAGVLALLALAAALALLGDDGRFAALRAAPPEGWTAMVFLLLAVGAAAVLGGMMSRGHAADLRSAFAGIAAGQVGLNLLARLLFDLGGPLVPPWWGLPLLALGAAAALAGGVRAVLGADFSAIVVGGRLAHGGLAVTGLGMALAARAVDDGPATTMALGAALFGALALGWQQALLVLVASAVAQGAGTMRLDRLGGLVARMRFTTAGALVAALALAALPPGAGFAFSWLLLQAAVLLPRGGGLDWWMFGTVAVLAVAMGGALLGMAALRLVGVAFLGRPRSPRAAAAEEVAPGGRWALLLASAAVLLCGLFPGVVVRLADPAVALLAGGGPVGGWQAGALAMAPGPQEPGYAALAIALLLAVAASLLALALRARRLVAQRAAPAWEGGQGAPPPWMPFGDPATQPGPAGFAEPVARVLRGGIWPRPRLSVPRPAWRRTPVLARAAAPAMAGAMALALLLAVAAGAG